MKPIRRICIVCIVLAPAALLACGRTDTPTDTGAFPVSSPTPSTSSHAQSTKLRPIHTFMVEPLAGPLSAGPGFRAAMLPIPVKQPEGLRLAIVQMGDVGGIPLPSEELARIRNQVTRPGMLVFLDPRTGEYASSTLCFNPPDDVERYGIPDPPGRVVGHMDDPKWLPKDRVSLLRQRIYSALDVLLPFFADENRPWTEEANKAAQEVRDFFPLAAEPGLWPYYKVEGKEFFAWVEKNAPPPKAVLPWEPSGQ